MPAMKCAQVVILEKEGEKPKCFPGLNFLVDYFSSEYWFPNANDLLTLFMMDE